MTTIRRHQPFDAPETAVRRADAALPAYPLPEDGRRACPSETLQRVITDLLHWCDDTQRDVDAALAGARTRHPLEVPDD